MEACEITLIHKEIADEAQESLPDDSVISGMADFFKVFGDPTRVRILTALRRRELCVCDIAYVLGMSSSAVSHQLRGLKSARLVKNRREGKIVYYSLSDEHVEKILDLGFTHMEE